MMSKAIADTLGQDRFLLEGHVLALQFSQGWAVFRITGREQSNVKPYSLGDVSTVSNLSDWNEIKDADARRYLEPPEKKWLNQAFWGVNRPKARVYLQYPPRRDRWNLVAIARSITGDVGFVDGDMSPYEGPYSPKTELFTTHELYPAFQVYNPTADTLQNVCMAFDVMRYSYSIIKERETIRQYLIGERRCRLHSVAGIDPEPAVAPQWLVDAIGTDLLSYTKTVVG